MNADELWAAIDTQRLRTTDLLHELTPAEWDTPSLCNGWTVRDVAAHLTLQQMTLGNALQAALRHPGSLNRIIDASARDRATRPTDRLVADIRDMVGSRRHNVGVTPLETLIDIVVHGQDIAVPLGRELAVPPTTAVTTADRLWWSRSTRIGRLRPKVFADLDHRGLRFIATDADWTAGEGDEVRGPLLSIVLLLTGRPVGPDALEGPGVPRLGRRLDVANGPGSAASRPSDPTTKDRAGGASKQRPGAGARAPAPPPLWPAPSPNHNRGGSMKHLRGMVAPVLAAVVVATPANADSPARERELTCSNGIVFVGQQVRMGDGQPPHVWRNVDPGGSPAAFSFHAASVTAPDGTLVESETWDTTAGVERNQDLVVCSFVIPIGPLTGNTADFVGFFLP